MSWFKSLLAPVLGIAGNALLPGVGGIIGSAIGGAIAGSGSKNQAQQAQQTSINTGTQATNQQLQLADAELQRKQNVYNPLEDKYLQQAQNYGSEANRTKAAEDAAGTVASTYANLRSRLASTPGLDPSSTKYLDTAAKIGLDEAAHSAAAQTGARNTVDAQGASMLKDAVTVGNRSSDNASNLLRGAAASASALGTSGERSNLYGDQTASSVGRMVGNVASDPTIQSGVKNLFNKVGGMFDTSSSPTSSIDDNFYTNPQYGV